MSARTSLMSSLSSLPAMSNLFVRNSETYINQLSCVVVEHKNIVIIFFQFVGETFFKQMCLP